MKRIRTGRTRSLCAESWMSLNLEGGEFDAGQDSAGWQFSPPQIHRRNLRPLMPQLAADGLPRLRV